MASLKYDMQDGTLVATYSNHFLLICVVFPSLVLLEMRKLYSIRFTLIQNKTRRLEENEYMVEVMNNHDAIDDAKLREYQDEFRVDGFLVVIELMNFCENSN